MAVFQYQARQSSGKTVKGKIEAASQQAAADALLEQGMIPLQFKETTAQKSLSEIRIEEVLGRKMGLEELLIFSRQMYSLTKAGIPLLQAIRGLAASTSSPRLSETLLDVVEKLEQGRPLSAAMQAHPKVFSQLYVSLIHVGENTGQLDSVFDQLATYLEQEQETRRRIKTAMRYPIFVIVAIAIALVVVNIKVIPQFASMFAKFNTELPTMTKVLIASSNFFVNYWPALLFVLIAALIGSRVYLSTSNGRYRWDKLKLKLPIVGDIIDRSSMARFCRSFAVMMRSGVPITQGLSLVAGAVDNAYMAQSIQNMRRSIEGGEALSRTAQDSGLFSALVMQMLVVGEETGRMDELLLEAAEFYEREVDFDLKSLTARIEPILIAFVAGLVLVLALGIFTPMWDMYKIAQG